MGKQRKKVHEAVEKQSEWQRLCEQCGNEVFSPNRVFVCHYCGWKNGISDGKQVKKEKGIKAGRVRRPVRNSERSKAAKVRR